jgi:MGT family glycosyltransferase
LSRALYFALPGEGHINPSLGLVQELVQRGEEIIYFCGDESKDKIIRSGAKFRSLGSLTSRQGQREIRMNINPLERENRILCYITKTIARVLNQVKKDNIDYVIFDTQFVMGKIIAQQLGLPCVSFCTTFAFSKRVLGKMRTMINESELAPTQVEERRELREHIANQYGFSFPDSIMFNTGDITLVCTSKYFQPESECFDDTFKFIGPSITDRNDNGDFPIDALKKRRTIFISMGTVVNEQPELYFHCLKAFADFDALVVMSIGKRLKVEDFRDIPPNYIVRNYVPQLQVLQNSDVFITHCGMNSTSEALYYDVPLVMNPIGADQPMVAERVKMLGAGILLDKSQLNSLTLREAVTTVLSDKRYVEKASKVGKSMRSTGGFHQGADEIFSFKRDFSIT